MSVTIQIEARIRSIVDGIKQHGEVMQGISTVQNDVAGVKQLIIDKLDRYVTF